MLQCDRAVRVDNKTDVEETVGPVLVARLRLRHDEHTPLPRQPPKAIGLRSRNIDRAIAREFGVVNVEHLVVESLERALGNRDEANRNIQIGEPEGSSCQAFQVIGAFFDVLAAADTPKARDQPDSSVRLDHPDPRILSISHVTVSISAMPSTRRSTPRAL